VITVPLLPKLLVSLCVLAAGGYLVDRETGVRRCRQRHGLRLAGCSYCNRSKLDNPGGQYGRCYSFAREAHHLGLNGALSVIVIAPLMVSIVPGAKVTATVQV
jgi:hypothetical protein